MDFALSEDQRAIEDAASVFAEAEMTPHSARWDEDKHFPVEMLRAAAALGFAGIYVGEDVGGSGLTQLDASIIFEALARGDVSTAAFLSIHNMASVDDRRLRLGRPAPASICPPHHHGD